MATLSSSELARYSRQISLPGFGVDAQQRLKEANVFVVGAGGLGSPIITYLAAAGVGAMTIVDPDVVDESNLQRQTIHSTAELGQPKVLSAKRAVERLNPHVNVQGLQTQITSTNAVDLVSGHDIIIDGSDNFVTRYLISDLASLLGIPCVWGAVFQSEGQAAFFWDSPISPQPTDLRDLYEQPPPPEYATSCEIGGVLGTVCLSVASFMANETIKWLSLGRADSVGKLYLFDGSEFGWRTIRISRRAERQRVAGLGDYEQLCGISRPRNTRELDASALAGLLSQRLEGSSGFVLVDVREKEERELLSIPGSVHLPLSAPDALTALARLAESSPLILYCASGIRSGRTLDGLLDEHGVDARHLSGGMRSWSGNLTAWSQNETLEREQRTA